MTTLNIYIWISARNSRQHGLKTEEFTETLKTRSHKQTLKQAHSASLTVGLPQCPAELVVVHLGFALSRPPQSGHLIGILDDKLAVVPLPCDDIMILLFPEQLQDEVP
ncbi:hypothetical protein ILYODFUR_026279 [Ilyodon furcidens]|uniref:Uncharacterized protein n=1 Tax=Ilyodon furcidens TaxID=33524 RepID=A0ABV0TB75_9TELE